MNEEIYDPYDVSNYTNPINRKKSSDQNELDNNSSEPNTNTGTNVFNPYENNSNEKNDSTETTILKQNSQNNSDSIDLTKNAYSKEENDSTKNDEKNKTENDEEEELPLLEELGINPQSILNKIFGVITLKRIDKKFVEDTDMGGPLLIFLIFAFSLVLQYKTCFGYIYSISLFGSVLIFILLNLMSKNKEILLYNTISVLGYCLIPIVLLSFIAIFLSMKNILGGILSLTAIILSSLNASRFFEIGLEMYTQRWLIFYPVALFYTCFVLVTIY